MTPLAFAAFNDRVESVDFLLSRGASLDINDDKGMSLVDLARERGNEEIAGLLEAAQRRRQR